MTLTNKIIPLSKFLFVTLCRTVNPTAHSGTNRVEELHRLLFRSINPSDTCLMKKKPAEISAGVTTKDSGKPELSRSAANVGFLKRDRQTAMVNHFRAREWYLDILFAEPLQNLDTDIIAYTQSLGHVRQMEP